jgi:glycosyltransferase involved in cell wall biosynthesis
MERRWLRRADSVVAVNESIALEYGRRYGRVPVVVRNCASRLEEDLPVRDLRLLAGLPETAQVVLYQGGFSAGRGLEVCVAAAADLPADTHLVLLGFGPLRETLVELAGTLGVTDRVHVLDAVPPEELAACTVSATVGLMPYQPVSRNNQLALPNKVFEYTAVGVPIVTSDLPELRRIAVDAGCGEVYDPFDATSLATALRRVLDPTEHERYRSAARAFGRTNVWENEREILVAELLRISPRLGHPELARG